jgi:osmoprotectant transport system substrate-binding protein
VITVGSFDFPESVLLAHLYAEALSARGYPARVLPDRGSRELVEPALMTGLVQLVPEYTGSALEFVSLGRAHATADVAATASVLASWMAARGIVTGRPAAAQDTNAIVVTGATASRYRLRTISDLARAAPGLVFGGPPECPERPGSRSSREPIWSARSGGPRAWRSAGEGPRARSRTVVSVAGHG